MTDKPIDQINVGSGIKAEIWKNTGERGDYFTVSVHRSYKGDDDEWHRTNSYQRDQLPKLALACNLAFERIIGLQYDRSEEQEQEESFAEREKARRGKSEASK